MEPIVRDTLLSAVADHTAAIEEIHLFEHWVVVKTSRFEMSTRFDATLPGYTRSGDTWLGDLPGRNAAELAREYLASTDVLKIAVGMACLKCVILPVKEFFGSSAVDHFAQQTRTRPTCFIGHFAEAAAWRDEGRPVSIVELQPRPGDIHWNEAHGVMREAELVFMTGLTLVNGTFGEVVRRTPAARHRIIMGPTVPLTPALFRLGLTWAGTTQIIDAQKTMRYFGMGGGSVRYAPPGALRKINIDLSGPTP